MIDIVVVIDQIELYDLIICETNNEWNRASVAAVHFKLKLHVDVFVISAILGLIIV